jgi:hypothetical protein
MSNGPGSSRVLDVRDPHPEIAHLAAQVAGLLHSVSDRKREALRRICEFSMDKWQILLASRARDAYVAISLHDGEVWGEVASNGNVAALVMLMKLKAALEEAAQLDASSQK